MAKEALAAEAEALLPAGRPDHRQDERSVTSRSAGRRSVTSRAADKERVEGRLRRVEQAVREAEESKWKRTNPEARARAEATVELLTTAITKLEKTLATARGRRGHQEGHRDHRGTRGPAEHGSTRPSEPCTEFSGSRPRPGGQPEPEVIR